MPSIHWFKPTKAATRSTQGTANRQRRRVHLTKEARAVIQERRASNRADYDADIKLAEQELVSKVEALATTHHKSIYQVERDLRMSSLLTRKRQTKANTWNAFIWSQAQEKNSTSTPLINTSSANLNIDLDGTEGRGILPAIVANQRDEYNMLTPAQSKDLVEQYEEHKSTKATARRVTPRQRVNDMTQALLAFETEVNLHDCPSSRRRDNNIE